jgi:hypothetical protein
LAEPVAPNDINGDIDGVSFVGKVTKVLPSGVFFVSPVGLFMAMNCGIFQLSQPYALSRRGEVIGFLNHFTNNVTHGN